MDPVKVEDGYGEEATESVSDLRTGVEDGSPQSELLSVVEKREEEESAWEEDSLDKAQEEAAHQSKSESAIVFCGKAVAIYSQSNKAMDDSHQSRNNTPYGHRRADVDSR